MTRTGRAAATVRRGRSPNWAAGAVVFAGVWSGLAFLLGRGAPADPSWAALLVGAAAALIPLFAIHFLLQRTTQVTS